MGIGGSGASGVAKLATKQGYNVSGCDLEKNTAYFRNVVQGHSARHVEGADLVVVSPAVYYQNSHHPEFKEAKKQGKLMTWQEFLGKILLKGKKIIAVAGTHGKSTTTAMAAKLLIDAGFDPIALVGAKVPAWGGGSRFGKGDYAVIEADEFNDNFLNYSPEIAIVTNIEFDHPDYFKDEAQVKQSFKKFTARSKFVITGPHPAVRRFKLKVMGEHNQENANAVYELGRKLGINGQLIRKSLAEFNGIGRRMELLGKAKSGFLVYDDYAHHPTEIKATVSALREKYPKRKIWVVVEAHGYVRTHALLEKYKGVFKDADEVVVGPIFKARDKQTFGMTPDLIAKASGFKGAIAVNKVAGVIKNLKFKIKNSDVVLVMGAGKSHLWARKILKI